MMGGEKMDGRGRKGEGRGEERDGEPDVCITLERKSREGDWVMECREREDRGEEGGEGEERWWG